MAASEGNVTKVRGSNWLTHGVLGNLDGFLE